MLRRDNVASAARFLLRHTIRGRTHDIALAVTTYRSKFSDCSVGTVANSYPNVDLLWDNVIAGLPSWPRNSASCKSRPDVTRCGGSGRLRYARQANFQLRNGIARWHGSAGTDQFVMTRPNRVRRDKSRPAIPPDPLAGRGALYVKHSGVLVSEEPDDRTAQPDH